MALVNFSSISELIPVSSVDLSGIIVPVEERGVQAQMVDNYITYLQEELSELQSKVSSYETLYESIYSSILSLLSEIGALSTSVLSDWFLPNWSYVESSVEIPSEFFLDIPESDEAVAFPNPISVPSYFDMNYQGEGRVLSDMDFQEESSYELGQAPALFSLTSYQAVPTLYKDSQYELELQAWIAAFGGQETRMVSETEVQGRLAQIYNRVGFLKGEVEGLISIYNQILPMFISRPEGILTKISNLTKKLESQLQLRDLFENLDSLSVTYDSSSEDAEVVHSFEMSTPITTVSSS